MNWVCYGKILDFILHLTFYTAVFKHQPTPDEGIQFFVMRGQSSWAAVAE